MDSLGCFCALRGPGRGRGLEPQKGAWQLGMGLFGGIRRRPFAGGQPGRLRGMQLPRELQAGGGSFCVVVAMSCLVVVGGACFVVRPLLWWFVVCCRLAAATEKTSLLRLIATVAFTSYLLCSYCRRRRARRRGVPPSGGASLTTTTTPHLSWCCCKRALPPFQFPAASSGRGAERLIISGALCTPAAGSGSVPAVT